MIKQNNMLHSTDIVVSLALVATPQASYQEIADQLGISTSTAHAAVRRLAFAGLVRPGTRTVNRLGLLEFLRHGIQYAFPARPGPVMRGVPTAHAGPPLAAHIQADQPWVWPDAGGAARGPSLAPLYPGARTLPSRAPAVYQLLTLVDAIRAGRVRERALAAAQLGERLAPQ